MFEKAMVKPELKSDTERHNNNQSRKPTNLQNVVKQEMILNFNDLKINDQPEDAHSVEKPVNCTDCNKVFCFCF